MNDLSSDVASLSDDQVEDLLSLGFSQSDEDAAKTTRDLLDQATADTSGDWLKSLLANLDTPVGAYCGPLPFKWSSGSSPADVNALAGRTFLEVLVSPQSSLAVLESLAEYGQMVAHLPIDQSTRFFGCVIRGMALSALRSRFGRALEPADATVIAATIDVLKSARPGFTG